ncbi:hypothetical protein [Bdellovibrio sp. HCB2-146]|uniref:hypothetical protein n=1 Tax=Bdellovibrio sp. HCB2-146 TaxID=3394362 RepID=UPI0039BD4AB3
MGNERISVHSKNYKRLRTESGSIILGALALAVVVAILILSSTNYIRSRATQVYASSDKLANRIVLDGLLSYTVNAVKQSWCFSSTWAQDTTCGLTHGKYAARLLLNDETIAYIQTSGMKLPTGDLRLTEISQTVTLSLLPESHPIYRLTIPFRGVYPTVSFSIKRDDSAVSTTKGKEVPLRIVIKAPAPVGSKLHDLEINSKIVVYPRELSYFALIVPNDLYLGSVAPANRGNVVFNNVAVGANKGLRFESPVFVNGNLVLPPKALTQPMKNVSFVDKVVIGEGMFKQDGNFFVPKDAGGESSMFNYKIPSFNGLLGGFELDVERDMGLDYLFKIQPSSDTFTDFELCKKRQMAAYDLTVTRDSQLFVKALSSVPNTADLTVSIGLIDNLIEQVDEPRHRQITTNVPGVTDAGVYNSFLSGAVFKAKMIFEGLPDASGTRGVYTNSFYLSRNGSLTLYPRGAAAGAAIRITSSPHYVLSKPQHNQVDLKVEFVNPAALNLGQYQQNGVMVDGAVRFILEAMDYGYNYSQNVRSGPSVHATMGQYKSNGFTFLNSGGNFVLSAASMLQWYNNPMLISDPSYPVWDPAQAPGPTDRDFNSFDAKCFGVPEGSEAYYTSFPSASWSTSFVTQSEHAWKFSADAGFTNGYFSGNYIFNSTNAGTTPKWEIKSLIETCTIESTATFVTGFYTCNNLIINARSTPLRIVGTFIAKNVQIDSTAYVNGIRWSTIYHPQAVYELRAFNILGKEKDGTLINCEDATLPPLWASNLGIPSTLKHYNCNPVSLRTADPFKWTTVDPDCGIPPGSVEVKCKKAATRFLVKEISRSKGL